MKRITTQEMIDEIVKFGECFIGTFEVQGMTVLRRVKRLRREFEKQYPGHTLAYNTETGICWWV